MHIVDILSKLIPNVYTMITQLCASAILFFALYKLAYKPAKKILDERSKYAQSKLDEADQKLKEVQEANDNIEAMKLDASKKANEIVLDAQAKAKKIVEDAEVNGKKQADKIIEHANKQIEAEHEKMLKEVQDEIIANVFTTIENKLEDHAGDDVDQISVDTFLKEVGKK